MAVTTIASPGMIARCGAVWRNRTVFVSIVPHSGVDGSCGPRPRKPSPAASMIAVASARVPATITGDIAFGRMCEPRIERRGTPTARAARTKSFSRCASTVPRRSRAKIGTLMIPIAIMICVRPGPRSATIPIAMRKPGIVSQMSVMRMITESIAPPTKPAMAPRMLPKKKPTVTETTPIRSE